MEFEETRLYYSHQQLHAPQSGADNDGDDAAPNIMDDNDIQDKINMNAVRRHFREFLRKYTDWQFVWRWWCEAVDDEYYSVTCYLKHIVSNNIVFH